jgi:hypothetical protein
MATDFRTLLEERERQVVPGYGSGGFGYRIFKRIQIGDIFLSVQGHDGAYSEPKRICDVMDYESMEVALMDKDGEWISPRQKNWPPELKKFEEDGHWSTSDDVAAYVPVAVIQEVYEALLKMAGKYELPERPDSGEWKATGLSDWLKTNMVFTL